MSQVVVILQMLPSPISSRLLILTMQDSTKTKRKQTELKMAATCVCGLAAQSVAQGSQQVRQQAEAERLRRAKIIGAEAEFQAARKLVDAAQMMSEQPMSLQMRYLQTLTEVAAEKNSTILFPIPIDLLKPFLETR